ncbi:MAG TPA: glycosyltransferase family 39 protein [Vicinamibacterales bacterium]|nr:glycosyltransferase family 39 protein [Vicinamibacterales bacterium]
MRLDRDGRDAPWIGILAGAFLFGLSASWQRWGNLLIDTGREVNQPLRLLAGETLYGDIRHIYGPLSPWFHAALFHLFGPSLTVLYVDGIVSAVVTLAIVYWVSRQIMSPAASGAATLGVMFLCVFKPAGNYFLPYSYNALHGCVLSLLTLAVVVHALRKGQPSGRQFAAAGVLAGLALLAKTESGLAAVAAGVTGAFAAGSGATRGFLLAGAFAAPAILICAGVYGTIAARVGWSTLVEDSWLLLYNVPPELRHYNGWISGLSHPAHSLRRVLTAAAKLGVLAAIISAVSNLVVARTRRRHGEPSGSERQAASLPKTVERGVATPASVGAAAAGARDAAAYEEERSEDSPVSQRRPWPPSFVLPGAAAVAAALSLTIGLDWDKGPFLAMPLLLLALIAGLLWRLKSGTDVDRAQTMVLLTCAVFALVSLARMILHVRSGGAHASYLLPASVVLFTFLWVGVFPSRFAVPRAGRLAATIALALIVLDAFATAAIQAYRYRTRHTVAVATARGTAIVPPDIGQAWNEALAFIDRHTQPQETVAVLPEGTSLTFLSGRRHPLREEITTPGFLDEEGEARAMDQLTRTGTRLILITNRPTGEFGPVAFGRDYNQRLMRWIEARYRRCATFGPANGPDPQIGQSPFFIRAYCAW